MNILRDIGIPAPFFHEPRLRCVAACASRKPPGRSLLRSSATKPGWARLRNLGVRISHVLLLAVVILNSALAAEAVECDRCMKLGGIRAFAEMVNVGVKQLALSSTLTTPERDQILDEAQAIAAQYGVQLFDEADLLVTDLFPHDVAVNKHVLLIYKGDTLEKYLDLKRSKADLIAKNVYDPAAREQLARSFGRLLSYPEEAIDRLLHKP